MELSSTPRISLPTRTSYSSQTVSSSPTRLMILLRIPSLFLFPALSLTTRLSKSGQLSQQPIRRLSPRPHSEAPPTHTNPRSIGSTGSSAVSSTLPHMFPTLFSVSRTWPIKLSCGSSRDPSSTSSQTLLISSKSRTSPSTTQTSARLPSTLSQLSLSTDRSLRIPM